ncbi:hypothetical protein GCM10028895_38230 [Pontibacter rugosus]
MANTLEETNQPDHVQFEAMKQVQTPRQGRILTYWIGGIFLLIVLCLFYPGLRTSALREHLRPLLRKTGPKRCKLLLPAELSNGM